MVVVARNAEHISLRLARTGCLPAVPITARPQLLLQMAADARPETPKAMRAKDDFIVLCAYLLD